MIKIILWLSIFINIEARASDFIFSNNISKNKENLIQDDLIYLKNFDFQSTYPKTFELFEVNHFEGSIIYQWINKRVTYFVTDNILSRTNVLLFESLYKTNLDGFYPNEALLPYAIIKRQEQYQQGDKYIFDISIHQNADAIISNLGAALYLKGKLEKKIYHAKLNPLSLTNKIDLAIHSPRIGLLKIGEGFFGKNVVINKSSLKLAANRISRLSILAHEARHSDGNGHSLSYAHSDCPKDHYLYGRLACDESLNGPYTIGAQLALEMLKSEKTISTIDKEALKIIVLDNQSRVIGLEDERRSPLLWDSSPEEINN